jgi:phage terminase large subunit
MSALELPEKLAFLFEPYRYKGAYGGRGGTKSWGFASALLALGADSSPVFGEKKPLRIGCGREIQKSISDSVHQLLKNRIQAMDLEKKYRVHESYIEGTNGTLITFHGLRHNVANIKSLEGCDIFWVEEAEAVSKSSWDTLIPTIRKEQSEIWLTWNPELEEAETHQRFVINPPPNAKIVKIGWQDNPWFPEVLRQEKEYLKGKDYPAYLNVWEGHCKAAIEGAIFARELELATQEGRITSVPHLPGKLVHVYADLGFSDQAAFWFGQIVGMNFHWIRFYANSQERASHYIKYLKELPYAYGTIHLPHDADNEDMAADKTIAQQFREAFSSVQVVPRTPKKVLAIDAARSIFPMSYFDKENCADGLSNLRRYHYKVDLETGKIGKEPEHDIHSHGADAFQTAGQAIRFESKPRPRPTRAPVIRRSGVR